MRATPAGSVKDGRNSWSRARPGTPPSARAHVATNDARITSFCDRVVSFHFVCKQVLNLWQAPGAVDKLPALGVAARRLARYPATQELFHEIPFPPDRRPGPGAALAARRLRRQRNEQRAAFTQFLQTRIIDKPGVRVPQLTAEEKKSFGDYAAHYAVITDFNSGMDASVKPLNSLMQKGGMRTLSDIVARRDDLKTVQTALNDMGTALEGAARQSRRRPRAAQAARRPEGRLCQGL